LDRRRCPLACPFIYSCDEDVDYEHFRKYCFNPVPLAFMAYRECEIYRKKTEGKKKPREWLDELGGAAP